MCETLSEKETEQQKGWQCGSNDREHPSKCKALSSISRITHKTKKKKEKKGRTLCESGLK
jgi:hypothetical protein